MMNKTILLIFAAFSGTFSFAQNVGINSTGATPNANAILDVESTTKGVLLPRMTTTQRNAITPVEGLMVYNLDCHDYNYYNGSIWVSTSLGVPLAVSATYTGPVSFTATWNAAGGATAYAIDVSTSPSFASFVPGYNNLNVGDVLTYNVTGLTCGSTYYFRIRAVNACGQSGNSNSVSLFLLCCPNYTVASIAYAAPLGAGWTTVALGDDEVSASLPIGFTFRFYCLDYTSFNISSNGFITFNPLSDAGCCTGQLIPDVTDPNNLVACAWTDLDPTSSGNIRYQTVGVAPNRRLHVRYTNIDFFGSTSPKVSTHIILYETTNVVEVYSTNCNAITNLNTVTFGIENSTGTQATAAPGRNSATFTAPSEAWRFTP